MEPWLVEIEPRQLVGIHLTMSLADDKTEQLWRKFAPRLGEINHRVSTDMISMQIYGPNWNFNPNEPFIKWAAVEVDSLADIPRGMEAFFMTGGFYAVFAHRGPASEAAGFFSRIFRDWLPASPYELDDREHFEILPRDYDPLDPNAEENIWIPIKNRSVNDNPGRLDTATGPA